MQRDFNQQLRRWLASLDFLNILRDFQVGLIRGSVPWGGQSVKPPWQMDDIRIRPPTACTEAHALPAQAPCSAIRPGHKSEILRIPLLIEAALGVNLDARSGDRCPRQGIEPGELDF